MVATQAVVSLLQAKSNATGHRAGRQDGAVADVEKVALPMKGFIV